MTSIPPSWGKAEKLDAGQMADELFARTGTRLVVEGPCAGGEVGAAFVRWEDGHRSVLKWRPHSRKADLLRGPLAVCEAARTAGIPAPGTELVEQIGHAVVMVQELRPGTQLDHLDQSLLHQALSINDRQKDLLVDRPDIPPIQLYLQDDGPGYCLHEPLRQYSNRTAALERRIRAVTSDAARHHDAVHLDFHPGNLLAEGGSITGLVDWDGAGRGDRRLDLVTLYFGLHHRGRRPETSTLDGVLKHIPDHELQPLWAHMSLRLTDWAIRHHTDDDVNHWLDLAEQRL
ncbi:phosphotransferase [Kineosporia sp. NBRC 101731]|uniref:phosphotransferase n=1 Tax=Kineosporia sp. NBRC 101731 TaxID=3032199 RepID=UPI0024A17A06|nr:phosphotransferase [Kineosporia sp. NBRC 101731]GLY26910.1 hypothetical protein Kisp02_02750 [Kineosporia sp. NBRC 101731]